MAEVLARLVPPEERRDRPRRLWLAIASAGLTLSAILAWKPWESAEASRCDEATAEIDDVWNAETRKRITASFDSTGVPYADTASAGVISRLDDFSLQWSQAATAACLMRLSGAESDVDVDDFLPLCLDLRLSEMQDLIEVYGQSDAVVVERAQDAAEALTPTSWCFENAGIRTAALDGRALALRSSLSKARALNRLTKANKARELATDVALEAQRLGIVPLQAEALLELGAAENATHAKRKAFEDAFWLSSTAHAGDETSIRAAIALVALSPGLDAATTWRRHAATILARQPVTHRDLSARLLAALGDAATNGSEYDIAVEYQASALGVLETTRPPFDLVLLDAVLSYARALGQWPLIDESNTQYRRALEIVETRLGVDHPLAAVVHTSIGLNEVSRQALDSAEGELRAALRIYERNGNSNALGIANTRRALGETYIWSHRIDAGIEEIEVALTMLPSEKFDAAAGYAMRAMGTALMFQGRLKDSQYYWTRSIEIFSDLHGPHHIEVAIGFNGLGGVFDALGDVDTAMILIRRAAQIMTRVGNPIAAALQHANLGVLSRKRGRHQDAIIHCRHAVELYSRAQPSPDGRMAFPLRVMALALLDMGRPQNAIEPLENALLLHRQSTFDREEQPKTKLALARALWEAGSDRARAIRIAREAEAELVAAGDTQSDDYRETVDWLSRHE